jgi:hypothetical protein
MVLALVKIHVTDVYNRIIVSILRLASSLNLDFDISIVSISILTSTMIFSPCLEQYFIYTE